MIKTQLSALTYIRNWRVRLVYFLIIPILNTLLMVAVTGMSTGKEWQVATSSVLISGALLALGSISTLLVDDTDRGISLEVIVRRPFSSSYWGSKILVSAIVAEVMIIINGLLLWIFNPQINFITMIFVSPLAVLAGLILGITSFVVSMGMDDPYFASNIVSTIGYLVSGTLVTLDKYPMWLRTISWFFPFSHTINAVRVGRPVQALWDVPIMIGWLAVGIGLYYWRITTITNKPQKRTIL